MNTQAKPLSEGLKAAVVFLLVLLTADVSNANDKPLFECLKVGDSVLKDVYVVGSTAVDITVRFNGSSMRKLDRKNLPPEMQVLYPFDPKAAAEYVKQQEVERERGFQLARAKQEWAYRNRKEMLQRQRLSIKQQIAVLEKDLARTHEETDASRPRFRRRLTAAEIQDLERLTKRQRDLRIQIVELNDKVATIDKELAVTP